MAPAYRATFSWPASGEARIQDVAHPTSHALDAGFKYLSLEAISHEKQETSVIQRHDGTLHRQDTRIQDAIEEKVVGKLTHQEELTCVHNAALDNFCLLVFKVSTVESCSEAEKYQPPTRKSYYYKESAWQMTELNP